LTPESIGPKDISTPHSLAVHVKVALVGLGGVGRVLAHELSNDPRVSAIQIIDKVKITSRDVAPLRGRIGVDVKEFDAARGADLVRAIRGCDVVANTSVSGLNLALMKAALRVGADYLDVAATGPRKPGGLPGILEQLTFHDAFEKADRRALLSMGLDPGMSNVMAREASHRLETIDTIRIRSGGTVRVRHRRRSPAFIPLYSREAFFSDVRIRPTVWQRGRLEERDLLSEEEEYAFPDPVGTQKTFLMAHEEVKTLPLYLGKPVGQVDFKYAINPDLAQALKALENLGLFSRDRTIPVNHRRIPFRAAFESAFPEPSSVAQNLVGTKCLSVDVEGTSHGVRKHLHEDIALSHEEAARRLATTAVYYLTGVAASIGIALMDRGALPAAGTYPAESLEPASVFAEWNARGLPIQRIERSASN
jgi:saccharopine dehydrogenase (NAD+, L-lysine forming)